MKRGIAGRTGRAKIKDKTGGPPATILTYALSGLERIQSLRQLIDNSRKERESLRLLPTENVTKQIWWGLLELAKRIVCPRFDGRRPENAAQDLALVATSAARFLEDFAYSDEADAKGSIILAAGRKNYWPVLMRLGIKQKGNGQREVILEGTAKAKAYLCDIHLGQDADTDMRHIGDPDANLFKRTAAWVVRGLVDWQEREAWRGKLTPWKQKLISLEHPITTDNVEDWWLVAKWWLDEQWQTNGKVFLPLIAACKSKGRSLAGEHHELYASEVRRTVIDVRLKEAFFALAKRADL